MLVDKVYKGVSIKDTISILTGLGGDDCGYNFSIDERYIIYGSIDFVYIFDKNDTIFKQTEVIWTHRCKGTKLYKIEEINAIEKIIAETKAD